MALMLPMLEKVGLQLLLEPTSSAVIFRGACSTVGVILPAYQSFKAIEDKKDRKKDEQWLTYWVIYAAMSMVEGPITEQLLSKVPYYYHLKLALLLWLQMPQTEGARALYQRYLRPTLLRYQTKIDACIDGVTVFMAAIYGMYRIPLSQLLALLSYGAGQARSFITWFTDSSGAADSSRTNRQAGPTQAAAQFMTR
ncbi:TB2/DP1, HVA22 family-domain-containing protein [Haematococcus lacustris]